MFRTAILITGLLILGCQSAAKFRAQRAQPMTDNQPHQRYGTNLDLYISEWLGTPYEHGGMSKSGVDCSGFTSLVYKNCFAKNIPRVSNAQYNKGMKVNRSRIKKGDLIFFSNVRYGRIDHVGIYLGDGRFAHATESSGVTISELSEEYYQNRFFGACRY